MSRGERTIVIAGAGPVGLALACLLTDTGARARWRIVIVDSGAPPAWAESEMDLRVYALSRASERLLERVGAWGPIRARRVSPYRQMRIWERRDAPAAGALASAMLEFDSAEIGEPDLGHIVEDGLLRLALFERLQARDNVECRWHQSLERVAIDARHAVVTIGGDDIDATLLLAADGGRSIVRELVGMLTAERDYGQHALVAHVRCERSHAATAWQRFLPGGPLALLPLADGRVSIVWSLPTPEAERLVAAPEEAFIAALQSASDDVLGVLSDPSKRVALPLIARHAWRYCEHRVALVGDAAHTVHPLAGLGMNLGLLDAMAFGAVFADAVARDEDPGDRRVLRRYERARKGDNLATLLALDGLDRLFRLPAAFAPLRITGLGVVDRLPLAKRVLMQRALGLSHAGRAVS